MPQSFQSNYSQGIIGQSPTWLTRIGSFILFLIILLFFFFSYLIKYPETIVSNTSIASEAEPVLIVSKSSGLLTLKQGVNNKLVKKGDILGYIENETTYKSILEIKNLLLLKDSINKYSPFDIDTRNLGKFGSSIKELNFAINSFNEFLDNNLERHKQKNISTEMTYKNRLVEKQAHLIQQEEKKLKIEKKNFQRDSILYVKGVISNSEFLKSKQLFLTAITSIDQNEKENISLKSTLGSLKNQKSELNITYKKTLFDLKNKIENSYKNLTELIEKWEYTQVIKAPISGKAHFHKILNNSQQINSGDELVYIIPKVKNSYAFAYVNQSGVGKVNKGQKVLLKMDDFPFQEFGTIEAEIEDISPVYTKDGYLIKIFLPNGLKTNYKKQLPHVHHMKGSCEIITNDLRLIERFFFKFKHNLSKING